MQFQNEHVSPARGVTVGMFNGGAIDGDKDLQQITVNRNSSTFSMWSLATILNPFV